MEVKDVVKCSFPNWYHGFRKVTPRSIILPLPKGFVQYLLSDGILLPDSVKFNRHVRDDESVSSDDEENWDTADGATPESPKFEDFEQKVQESIKELGGQVFPKLNWSSPRDASWIALNNCLRCTSVSDIYLLLKSSDFIMHDITQPFLLCVDYDENVGASCPVYQEIPYYLILRQWLEINPDTEFRCFVKNNHLIAISQRDISVYSDYNVEHKNEIISDIVSFFHEHIHSRFPSSSYVFDVYRKREVVLLDFNPFGEVTDSLLFDWSELMSDKLVAGDHFVPEYRCINNNRGIQPRPFGYYAVPRDVVDIATGEDTYKFIDLLKLKINDQKDDSSDED